MKSNELKLGDAVRAKNSKYKCKNMFIVLKDGFHMQIEYFMLTVSNLFIICVQLFIKRDKLCNEEIDLNA